MLALMSQHMLFASPTMFLPLWFSYSTTNTSKNMLCIEILDQELHKSRKALITKFANGKEVINVQQH
jgi:hypothetical protein